MFKGICPICEKVSDLRSVSKREEIAVRNESIEVPVNYYVCMQCNGEFVDSKSKDDPLDIAYREYRKRHDMMQPEEIRDLRQKNGFTQRELSKLLGWGEVTLTRYENGALQDKTHDMILQMIKDPQNLLKIVEEKGYFLNGKKKERITSFLRKTLEDAHTVRICVVEHLSQNNPDIFTGFKRFDLDKLFEAIVFFCREGVVKTKLNKLLFYFDFKSFKNQSVSVTGARFVHLKHGPVPDNYELFLAILQDEEKVIELREEEIGPHIGEVYYSLRAPDLSIFSNEEIKILIEVKDYFKDFNATMIRDFSHKEKGYQETEEGQSISYSYAEDLRM